jgi:hypothetical protein
MASRERRLDQGLQPWDARPRWSGYKRVATRGKCQPIPPHAMIPDHLLKILRSIDNKAFCGTIEENQTETTKKA